MSGEAGTDGRDDAWDRPDLYRLDLYRYATADDPAVRDQYIAIMALFTDTLLTDLSASEVAAQLSERGIRLAVD